MEITSCYISICLCIFTTVTVVTLIFYTKLTRNANRYLIDVVDVCRNICKILYENYISIKQILSGKIHEFIIAKYETGVRYYNCSFFTRKFVILFDVRDIKRLKDAEGRQPKHLDFKHLRIYRGIHNLPSGLLVSNDSEWLRQRAYLGKAFSVLAVKTYMPEIHKTATSTIEYIHTEFCNNATPFYVDLVSGIYAANSFIAALYGSNHSNYSSSKGVNETEKIVSAVRANFKSARFLMMMPQWMYKFSNIWNLFCHRWDFLLLYAQINVGRCSAITHSNPSILSEILRHDHGDLGDMNELIVNAADMLTASIDTTSNLIQWCLYEIARHPAVQIGIVEEQLAKNSMTLTTRKSSEEYTSSQPDSTMNQTTPIVFDANIRSASETLDDTATERPSAIDNAQITSKMNVEFVQPSGKPDLPETKNENNKSECQSENHTRDEKKLKSMPSYTYLMAVIKETLRLHPVGFITSRQTQKDMNIDNKTFPPGTTVVQPMYVFGRNEEMFPDPHSFNPDRWLKGDKQLDYFYANVPFGFGPRMCLGKRVAEMMVSLFLAEFCLKFEFKLAEDKIVNPHVRLLLEPDRRIKLTIHKR